jgi:hypothetical protein
MSIAHLGAELRLMQRRRTFAEMHARGGPHPNTIARYADFWPGDAGWHVRKSTLDALTRAGAGLWPDGEDAPTLYQRPDDDPVSERLAELVAAKVLDALVNEIEVVMVRRSAHAVQPA